MNKCAHHLAKGIVVVAAFTAGSTARTVDSGRIESETNTQSVDACQGGAWRTRMDPEKTFAGLSYAATESRPAMLVANSAARRPYKTHTSNNIPIINGVEKQD